MGHCPHRDTDLRELVESDTDARYAGGVKVWECASCGAILETSGVGVRPLSRRSPPPRRGRA